MKINITIPNYNGEKLLAKNLPLLLKAIQYSKLNCQIIVVDDASKDGSVGLIKEKFPQMKLIINKINQGFGLTCDRGIRSISSDIFILFNNDIRVPEDFLNPLVKHFQDPKVFAVAAVQKVISPTETFCGGAAKGVFSKGLLRHINYFNNCQIPPRVFPILYANGGLSAFSTQKYLELGGFTKLFIPHSYWEDCDLSYRAWKRGYKVFCDPTSRAEHVHESTIKKQFSKSKVYISIKKNFLLFNWRNLTDADLLLKHFFWLPIHLLLRTLQGELSFLAGFFLALLKLPEVIKFRQREKKYIQRTDKEILEQWKFVDS